jgi:hypothetical protein
VCRLVYASWQNYLNVTRDILKFLRDEVGRGRHRSRDPVEYEGATAICFPSRFWKTRQHV